jgi:hypothetical protein
MSVSQQPSDLYYRNSTGGVERTAYRTSEPRAKHPNFVISRRAVIVGHVVDNPHGNVRFVTGEKPQRHGDTERFTGFIVTWRWLIERARTLRTV